MVNTQRNSTSAQNCSIDRSTERRARRPISARNLDWFSPPEEWIEIFLLSKVKTNAPAITQVLHLFKGFPRDGGREKPQPPAGAALARVWQDVGLVEATIHTTATAAASDARQTTNQNSLAETAACKYKENTFVRSEGLT